MPLLKWSHVLILRATEKDLSEVQRIAGLINIRWTMVKRVQLVWCKDSKCLSISEKFVQLLPWNMASSSSYFLSWTTFGRSCYILRNTVKAGWLKRSLTDGIRLMFSKYCCLKYSSRLVGWYVFIHYCYILQLEMSRDNKLASWNDKLNLEV